MDRAGRGNGNSQKGFPKLLTGSNFGKLDKFLALAKATVKVIVICFVFSFLYNIVGLGFAVSGNLTPIFAAILMPMSSISVALFATSGVVLATRLVGLK